jgi:hypothetical protein
MDHESTYVVYNEPLERDVDDADATWTMQTHLWPGVGLPTNDASIIV